MLDTGAVRPSQSPWAFPVVLAPKKDGTARLCLDYRRLNEVTRRDAYPFLSIESIMYWLGGARVFTTLDCSRGFLQIQVAPDDVQKTAFTCYGGLFEFTRLPFGLSNSPSSFQRLMDIVLGDAKFNFAMAYMDDVVVFSKSFKEHPSSKSLWSRNSAVCCWSAGPVIVLRWRTSYEATKEHQDARSLGCLLGETAPGGHTQEAHRTGQAPGRLDPSGPVDQTLGAAAQGGVNTGDGRTAERASAARAPQVPRARQPAGLRGTGQGRPQQHRGTRQGRPRRSPRTTERVRLRPGDLPGVGPPATPWPRGRRGRKEGRSTSFPAGVGSINPDRRLASPTTKSNSPSVPTRSRRRHGS
ncbi:reverse transcriptase/ribonuclease H [Ixodes scapularis]